MDEVPIALGLQIIDAQNLKDGIMRERTPSTDEDLDGIIDKAFKDKGHGCKN